MVSNHPAKFGGRRRCGSGDMFVVVGGQDSTCPCLDPPLLLSLKHMTCHALTHEISGRGRSHINLPVCPMKGSRSWPHMPTRTTDRTYLKLLPVSPKTMLGKKIKKEWQRKRSEKIKCAKTANKYAIN